MKLRNALLSAVTVLGAAIILVPAARAQIRPELPDAFQTHYYDVATSNSPSASGYGGHGASGGIGDGLVRMVGPSNFAPEQRGTVCANIYVFDDIEEMQACCGCPVTPDGVRTMSVINNLTKNFGVNRGNMNAGTIEILAASANLFLAKPVPLPPQIATLGTSGWACDPTGQFGPLIGASEEPNGGFLFNGVLRSWIDNTEGNAPVPAGSGALIKGVSVDEFQTAVLDQQHIDELDNFCLFLITNGSGTGACGCGSGDDFSKAPQLTGPPPGNHQALSVNAAPSGGPRYP